MRTVEVFAGAYASGKSETAINRARQFALMNKPITLVDLDTAEPAYTLRPVADKLRQCGINVITQPSSFGLGEAASYVNAEQINCLSTKGDIIIDTGYGAGGLDILEILSGIEEEQNLKIYLVVNTSKFETSTVENIVEYAAFAEGDEKRSWKKFSGLISNTHLGDETTPANIINGYNKLKEASKILNIPIIAIGAGEKLAGDFDLTYDGVDIWIYKRVMPEAFW